MTSLFDRSLFFSASLPLCVKLIFPLTFQTMFRSRFTAAVVLSALAGALIGAPLAATAKPMAMPAAITQAPFGTMSDGQIATLYTLRNARGGQVQITNYGGIVTALRVPDKNGVRGDVVLGFDTLPQIHRQKAPTSARWSDATPNRINKGRLPSMAKVTSWRPTTESPSARRRARLR